jgi:penicillin-binding protein 2
VGIDTSYFEIIANGMEKVTISGTARLAYIPGIPVCGKTGTAENSRGKDHSVFFAFAPKENPKIAIAVYVENSGYGGTYAAPIASLMIEKYMTDTIANNRKWLEQRMFDANLMPELP